MGLIKNIKKKFLNQKTDKNRKVEILPIDKVHNILIVLDNSENFQIIKNHLLVVFQKSKITTLSFRDKKNDSSNGYHYSFHSSDIGLGKIKNDRLIGLINTNFDLMIDFISEPTELDYFVKKSNCSLKVGDLNSSKNHLYDLLLERGHSNSDFIGNIKTQILLLSNNGNN
jgi:hypothetical protein